MSNIYTTSQAACLNKVELARSLFRRGYTVRDVSSLMLERHFVRISASTIGRIVAFTEEDQGMHSVHSQLVYEGRRGGKKRTPWQQCMAFGVFTSQHPTLDHTLLVETFLTPILSEAPSRGALHRQYQVLLQCIRLHRQRLSLADVQSLATRLSEAEGVREPFTVPECLQIIQDVEASTGIVTLRR